MAVDVSQLYQDVQTVTQGINAYRSYWENWLAECGRDVKATAKRYVDGFLLKQDTGRLYRSIKYRLYAYDLYVDVGSDVPYAKTWELDGVHGPIVGKNGEPIEIKKRGQGKIRGRFPVIFRKATYTKTTFKRPVGFLRAALRKEMLGGNGTFRLRKLGFQTSIIAVRRIKEYWQHKYGSYVRIGVTG